MKNLLIILSSILLLTTGIANASTPENKVCFNADIESFSLLGYSITSKQQFDGVKISDDDKACLVVTAGRDLSTAPQQWVQSGMKNHNVSWSPENMIGALSDAPTPDKLHFAINLDIVFKNGYQCGNFYLGQGRNAGGNNWWLFSNIDNPNQQTLSCSYKDSTQPKELILWPYFSNRYSFTIVFD